MYLYLLFMRVICLGMCEKYVGVFVMYVCSVCMEYYVWMHVTLRYV